MFNHLLILGVLLTGMLFFASACTHSTVPLDGTYTLTTINGQPYTGARPVTMTIEDNRLFGSGPINQWSAPLEDNKPRMVMSTLMAGDPDLMKAENELHRAIENTTLSVNEEGQLIFTKDGTVVITATPAPKP
jgi:heat shock protein HslJ